MADSNSRGQFGKRLFDGGQAELGALPLVNDTLTVAAPVDVSAAPFDPLLVPLLIVAAAVDVSAAAFAPVLVAEDIFLRSKILGTTLPRFQIGLSGPFIKQQTLGSTLGLDHKDSTDSAYLTVRGLDPAATGGTNTTDNDLTTKHFHDRRFSRSFLLMGG